MRILTSVPKWYGHQAADLSAEFYDEIVNLSRFVSKVYVLTDTSAKGNVEADDKVKIIGVRTINLPKIYAFTKILGYVLNLVILAVKGSIELVYVRQFSPPDLLLCILAKILGKRAVLLLGGTWLFAGSLTLRSLVYRLILRLSVQFSDKIILYSPLMRADVQSFTGKIPQKKISYVRNGVDVDRFSPRQTAEDELMSHWKISTSDLVVLYVGRLNQKKGVEEIVRAMQLVAKQSSKVKALLVGLVDDKYKASIHRLLSQLGLSDNVVIAGPVSNATLPKIYAASTLFVIMSRGGEGIPRALLEAMACGKTAISTPVAGIPDVVKDGETGVLVPVEDFGALAKVILRLTSDRDGCKILGNKAREFVIANHSWGVVAPQLAACLKAVLK